jgi:hypothetical protein
MEQNGKGRPMATEVIQPGPNTDCPQTSEQLGTDKYTNVNSNFR